MSAALRLLATRLDADRGAYADVEADGDRFTIPHEHTRGEVGPSLVGTWSLSAFGDRAVRELRAGGTLVVHDVVGELGPTTAFTGRRDRVVDRRVDAPRRPARRDDGRALRDAADVAARRDRARRDHREPLLGIDRAGPRRARHRSQRAPLPRRRRRHAAAGVDRRRRRRRRLLQRTRPRLPRHRGRQLAADGPSRRSAPHRRRLGARAPRPDALRLRAPAADGGRPLPLAPEPGRAHSADRGARTIASAGSAPRPTSTSCARRRSACASRKSSCATSTGARTSSSPSSRTSCATRWRRCGRAWTCCASHTTPPEPWRASGR